VAAPILKRFFEIAERRESAERVAAATREAGGSVEVATTSWSATTAGDRRQLRGIPAVSRAVGGVSPGTDPVAELMRKQPR
jgi:hypothetical protein